MRHLIAYTGCVWIGVICEHYIRYGWEVFPFFLAATCLWGWVCAME